MHGQRPAAVSVGRRHRRRPQRQSACGGVGVAGSDRLHVAPLRYPLPDEQTDAGSALQLAVSVHHDHLGGFLQPRSIRNQQAGVDGSPWNLRAGPEIFKTRFGSDWRAFQPGLRRLSLHDHEAPGRGRDAGKNPALCSDHGLVDRTGYRLLYVRCVASDGGSAVLGCGKTDALADRGSRPAGAELHRPDRNPLQQEHKPTGAHHRRAIGRRLGDWVATDLVAGCDRRLPPRIHRLRPLHLPDASHFATLFSGSV